MRTALSLLLPPSPGRAAGGRSAEVPAGPEPRSLQRGRREEGKGRRAGAPCPDCGPEEASRGAVRSPGGAGGQRRGRPGPLPLALPSRSSLSRAVCLDLRAASLTPRALSLSPQLSPLCVSGSLPGSLGSVSLSCRLSRAVPGFVSRALGVSPLLRLLISPGWRGSGEGGSSENRGADGAS